MIKFWDYLREYRSIRPKILKSIDKVFYSGKLIFGNQLKKFEKDFCEINDVEYGIGVKSGTDALHIALKSLNIQMGDEVITVSNTAIPTISAIKSVGAVPKFVDVASDLLIDVNKIEKVINSKTKVIMPVHLFGQVCNMDFINNIAKKYDLKVIEDVAQSCGAKYKGKNAGSIGHIGCYSFYPTKILGTYGDGGFVATNDRKIYEKMHRIRFYGIETLNPKNKWYKKYYSNEHGTNSRLDEVQASILNIKLKHMKESINKRRSIAKRYLNELKDTNINLPLVNRQNRHVFHIFAVKHIKRDEIIKKMKSKKIYLNIHYPCPIHKMKAYKGLVCDDCDCLPYTEKFSKEIFSLPIHPYLKYDEVSSIIKNLKKIISKF